MNAHKLILTCAVALALSATAAAGCQLDIDDLEDLVGYEIEDVKTVAGWVDEDDGKVGNADDWEGCRYNRKIIFDDGTSIICKSYDHSSAWGEQEAVVFKKYSNIKVCIDDEIMDVRG